MPQQFLGRFCLRDSRELLFFPIPARMGTYRSALADCPTGTVLMTMHVPLPSRPPNGITYDLPHGNVVQHIFRTIYELLSVLLEAQLAIFCFFIYF